MDVPMQRSSLAGGKDPAIGETGCRALDLSSQELSTHAVEKSPVGEYFVATVP